MKNILVIAAHPDDEILGCGGTMARHARDGERVHIVILAEGETSRAASRGDTRIRSKLKRLSESASKAAKIIGAASSELLGFPDNRLDSVDLLDVIKPIEAAMARYRPSVVYTHHAGDVNIDHQIAHAAVLAACRPQPGHSVRSLRFFEVPSSTEWQAGDAPHPFFPNWFIDISATLKLKRRALEAYAQEMRPWPHPRSYIAIDHLARWRGATAGVQAAEAFILGREIER